METQRIETQDSLEFGQANKRLKIHFWDTTELQTKITAIKSVINEESNKRFIEELNTK